MDNYWQAAPREQCVVGLALRRACELDAPHAPGKSGQYDFCLEARHGLPDAAMNAHAEPDVTRSVTCNIETVWLAPAARIAVGGSQKEQYFLPGWNAYSGHLDLARCGAKEGLHRGLPAYRFFKSRFGQRWVLLQETPLIWMAGEGVNSGGYPIDGG